MRAHSRRLRSATGSFSNSRNDVVMAHIVLLGDSLFDNQPYVAPGRATINELSARVPRGWQATLRAHDGDYARDVIGQLRRAPESATHLVVSAGGNDALAQQQL